MHQQHALEFDILPQPDETTCGPTCLHAVYRYFGDSLKLDTLISETAELSEGGTLAVMLGCHALSRGYRATIVTMNLQVFDPTWFFPRDISVAGLTTPHSSVPRPPAPSRYGSMRLGKDLMIQKLEAQAAAKQQAKLSLATRFYIDFLQLGGSLVMRDFDAQLVRGFLKRGLPILTGLSSTFLYQSARELPDTRPDDVAGFPTGHFVVVSGYDPTSRLAMVADPYLPNPLGKAHHYQVPISRLVTAILLGVLTYDANLLIIEPATDRLTSDEP